MKARQWIYFLIITLVAGFVLSGIPAIRGFVEYRYNEAVETGGAGRLDIWRTGILVFLDHPILGVGFDNFEEEMNLSRFERSSFNISLESPFRNRVAHNIYLQTAGELGIIGLLIFLFWMWSLAKTKPRTNEHVKITLLFIAMLIGGLTNPELNRKYFWLSVGLAEGMRYSVMLASRKREQDMALSSQRIRLET